MSRRQCRMSARIGKTDRRERVSITRLRKPPHHRRRLFVEALESRQLLAGDTFNDPDYAGTQWGLNNTGQNGATFDVDIDALEAWSITTGSMSTVVAEIDDGVDFTHVDVYLNIWLNQGEIPPALQANLTDTDSDGLITFRDLNHAANTSMVPDRNANGYIDGGDLLLDPQWTDGVDDDSNGRPDDLVGWDILDNDNDPRPAPGEGHGTGMVQWMGAIPNNGIGKVGVNWKISVMPVRARTGPVQNVDFSVQAAGLDYAVENGAPIAAVWGHRNATQPQVMFDAVERARVAGALVVVPAGNDYSNLDVSPVYPACLGNDNLLSVTAINPNDGLDSAWNWGATCVDLAGPTAPSGGTSGGTAHVAGVAALLKTIHPDWDYEQLKDRILSTVEPSAALAGKTVTGGRLNAARALAATSISITDPAIVESNSGTVQLTFQVTRFGDDFGEVVLDWSTLNGSATAGSDYAAATGQISFSPGGSNSQPISIAISGDTVSEPNETFSIVITQISGNALLADATAQGTILSDDTPLAISDSASSEGSAVGHYRGAFVNGPIGTNFNDITFGPDGYFYTSPGPSNGPIDRYDAATGAFVDHFIFTPPLSGVRDIVFRDGFIYVASEGTDEVVRFSANTGAYIDRFVTGGSGGIDAPHALAFGPDVNADGVPELYVSGRNSFTVIRYDGATGQPLGSMNTSGSGALSWPEGMTVGPDGMLYVASTGNNAVKKFNPLTGNYLGTVTHSALLGPKGVRFGPDGLLYVTSSGNDRILRFTAAGSFVDDFVPSGSGGMDDPNRLEFGPDGNLYVSALGSNQIPRFGTESEVVFTVSLTSASSLPVSVDFATADATAAAGNDYVSSAGTVTFQPGITTRTILVPLLDDTAYEGNETFVVNLSNPVGASIADAQGVATIQDNEPPPTKFYVVNDASTNRTYEYNPTGGAVENYSLNNGNSAPRGAASTAAGDKIWVVDSNKKVYVYDTSGGLLGSWTAGSLPSSTTIEGIATNGTDIWIVDEKSDKVYKYANAASRLSGSQNAASSFTLNSSNSAAKDIVTDGTSLWVVNSASTDKVFKYSIAGALQGSWTISTSGASSPTGITLDPSNPNHLWIVDSGTDRVYQYDAAVARVSGSQSASSSFALAAANSNPQGIADPPPPANNPVDVRRLGDNPELHSTALLELVAENSAGAMIGLRCERPVASRMFDAIMGGGRRRMNHSSSSAIQAPRMIQRESVEVKWNRQPSPEPESGGSAFDQSVGDKQNVDELMRESRNPDELL